MMEAIKGSNVPIGAEGTELILGDQGRLPRESTPQRSLKGTHLKLGKA